MQTLHQRLLKLVGVPVLALLFVGFSAASAGAQTITSQERVVGTNSMDIYTYYAEGVFSQLHIDSNGNSFTYFFDFNTGRSTHIFVSAANGYPTYIISDSQLGLVNVTNGWWGSPFYTSGNPFDASVQNTMALLFQEMPNLDPWGEGPWSEDRIRPSPILP